MDDVEDVLAEVTAMWRPVTLGEVMAAEAEVSVLHDLARRVETAFGGPAGVLLRRAADLVAEAGDELRRARLDEEDAQD